MPIPGKGDKHRGLKVVEALAPRNPRSPVGGRGKPKTLGRSTVQTVSDLVCHI